MAQTPTDHRDIETSTDTAFIVEEGQRAQRRMIACEQRLTQIAEQAARAAAAMAQGTLGQRRGG